MSLSRLKSLFNYQNKALVLMYHRINRPSTDPWNLSVTPENFEEHLRFLKDHYSVVSTKEMVQDIESKKIESKCVALTFDDGYLDNYITAKPLLEKYAVPATFFITDSYLENSHSFWWDELEFIIVHTEKLPSVFSVSFKDEKIYFDLEGEAVLNDEIQSKHANYKANKPPTLRTQLYVKLWKIFSPLLKVEQQQFLQLIREWAGLTAEETKVEGCMSAQQVKQLSDNPLFTIGGHTKTHPLLASHSKEVQQSEIIENQQFLQKLTNANINLFAYPSGNYDDSTIRILKDNYFAAAFTTSPGPVFKKTEVLEVNRFQVNNWNKKKFEVAAKKWIRFK